MVAPVEAYRLRQTPREVVEWTLVMGVSSILMEEQEKGDLLHLLKNIQFVLLGFRDSLVDLNQEETLMSSMLRVRIREGRLGLEYMMVVSSANRRNDSREEDVCKSFMYIKKRRGPNIEPWGTP